MSTKGINGIGASRRDVGVTADSARARHLALAEQAAKIVSDRDRDDENFEIADDENFEIAKRASYQEHNDRLTEIGEQYEQGEFILNGSNSAQPHSTRNTRRRNHVHQRHQWHRRFAS